MPSRLARRGDAVAAGMSRCGAVTTIGEVPVRCAAMLNSRVVRIVWLASLLFAAGCSSLLPYRPRDGAADAPESVDAPVDAAAPDASLIASTGPALYWRFDEESGAQALDSSGNGRTGVFTGETGVPSPAADVSPRISFADPRSRAFDSSQRQAVLLSPMPPALRPEVEMTVTAWYRATTVDTATLADGGVSYSGAELVSGGNQYVLRLRTNQVEFSKRVMGPAAATFAQCLGMVDNHLDGSWHHLAGVSSAQGLKVYLDGTERCANTTANATKPILYDLGTDLWVGRHGNNQTNWDFAGNLDEVRIYTRALTEQEIAGLAAGGQ
jgi:hypothetical protein